MALYRRYRPEDFQSVIGQEHVVAPLMAALRAGKTAHAYLFSGPRGCGKTTSARILARCLNCEQFPTDTPCGTCPSCRELSRNGGGSLDVVELDAASHGGVEDARELVERASFSPARDRYKIFIIDEAHMVTPHGFNALLKMVEEPPEHVKFIFATTEPEKVLPTIRSRTHHYPFHLVSPSVVEDYLGKVAEEEGVHIGEGVLPLVVRAGGGSMRDSLSVLDQLMAGTATGSVSFDEAVALLGYTDSALLDRAIASLIYADGGALFAVIEDVVEAGHDPRRFVEDLISRLRDIIVCALAGERANEVLGTMPEDQRIRLFEQAKNLGASRASASADIANEALETMVGATAPRLQLELLAARLLLAQGIAPSHVPSTSALPPTSAAPSTSAVPEKTATPSVNSQISDNAITPITPPTSDDVITSVNSPTATESAPRVEASAPAPVSTPSELAQQSQSATLAQPQKMPTIDRSMLQAAVAAVENNLPVPQLPDVTAGLVESEENPANLVGQLREETASPAPVQPREEKKPEVAEQPAPQHKENISAPGQEENIPLHPMLEKLQNGWVRVCEGYKSHENPLVREAAYYLSASRPTDYEDTGENEGSITLEFRSQEPLLEMANDHMRRMAEQMLSAALGKKLALHGYLGAHTQHASEHEGSQESSTTPASHVSQSASQTLGESQILNESQTSGEAVSSATHAREEKPIHTPEHQIRGGEEESPKAPTPQAYVESFEGKSDESKEKFHKILDDFEDSYVPHIPQTPHVAGNDAASAPAVSYPRFQEFENSHAQISAYSFAEPTSHLTTHTSELTPTPELIVPHPEDFHPQQSHPTFASFVSGAHEAGGLDEESTSEEDNADIWIEDESEISQDDPTVEESHEVGLDVVLNTFRASVIEEYTEEKEG